jgi:hypothetical protein
MKAKKMPELSLRVKGFTGKEKPEIAGIRTGPTFAGVGGFRRNGFGA